MRSLTAIFIVSSLLLVAFAIALPAAHQQTGNIASQNTYLGFDRNDYPGDDALPILRKTFSFASYWLGSPPSEKQSSWLGKRALLQSQGFGFLVLLNGKGSREINSQQDALRKGSDQAHEAAKLAQQEGFPQGTVIFLDIEEGGRLPAYYHEYLQAWYDALAKAGFHAGAYCSGIPVNEGDGVVVTTADDIHGHMGSRDLIYWVYNDACPPSPGCMCPTNPPVPSKSGIPYAAIWQFVRSPREKQTSRHCAGYANNGNCYSPGDITHKWFLDINVATLPDPSAPKK
jgi:hypothetical protein